MSFTDKVVLITGAFSGIGAAIALAFAKEGAKVAIVDRNEEIKDAVAASFATLSPPLILVTDIADDKQTANLVKKTVDHFGKLDILVNNAGICRETTIFDEDLLAKFDEVMGINLRAAIHLAMKAAPELIKTKGNVINISSVVGLKTMSTLPVMPYSISKAGLNHFTKCLALELAPYGVRVNAISPGPTRTDIAKHCEMRVSPDDFVLVTALKRMGEVGDIADLVLFLASDKAKSITGSNYLSDNGMRLL